METPRNDSEESGRTYLQRVRDEVGLYLVAAPLPSDLVEMVDGPSRPWSELGYLPTVPPVWWLNIRANSPITKSHVWLRGKRFITSVQPTLLQIFLVKAHSMQLPLHFLCEVLPDDYSLRDISIHLDAHLRSNAELSPVSRSRNS